MFFEEPKDKVEVKFEVDKKRAAVFEYFLETLNMTEAQAFDEMLGVLASKMANNSTKPESRPFEVKQEENRLPDEVVSSRIKKWARDINSYPHIMIQAYINASLILEEDHAWRKKMEIYFNDKVGNENVTISRFISVFRQMCSSSSRAYGDVFIYDRYTDNVYLNEKYKELIISLKDQFYPY